MNNNLVNFIPENYDSLTIEERRNAVMELCNTFFDYFGLENVQVSFNPQLALYKNDLGHFNVSNSTIYINQKYLIDNAIDNGIPSSYVLVETISHECYHAYQYYLIEKMKNGRLFANKDDFDKACFYFLASKLENIITEKFPDLEFDVPNLVYHCGPIEVDARNFSLDFMDNVFFKTHEHNAYKEVYFKFHEEMNSMMYFLDNLYNTSVSNYLMKQALPQFLSDLNAKKYDVNRINDSLLKAINERDLKDKNTISTFRKKPIN